MNSLQYGAHQVENSGSHYPPEAYLIDQLMVSMSEEGVDDG